MTHGPAAAVLLKTIHSRNDKMNNPIEVVRVDQRIKNMLVQLKRKTKVQNWNILCRWGFIISLTLDTLPNEVTVENDGAVEMSWKVFGGAYDHLIWALLKFRLIRDGIELNEDLLKDHFKRHLYRGIQHLSNIDFSNNSLNFVKTITDEVRIILDEDDQLELFIEE